jgi:crotonobetainyl-CoA:carnitine CoA-transferase CaiB-like acyl-CoA transferase
LLYETRLGPLFGLTVIDVSGPEGAYAGKLFADMGAKVTRFQPATDDDAAAIFLNLGKEVVHVDLDQAEGIARLSDAARDADVMLESFPPGTLERFGAGAARSMTENPKLIWAKISAFGSEGPYRDHRSSDLVNMAQGGMLTLAGYPDREPVLASGNQSYKIASLYCAVAVMGAYYERLRSSRGQYVEIPIQHAVATALENSLQFHDLQGVVRKRAGPGYAEAASGLFRCSDGLVFLMAGRLSTLRGWKALVTWLNEECPDSAGDLLDPRWDHQAWKATPQAARRFEEIFSDFARDRSKQELYLEAQRRGIALCPVNSVADVLKDPQLLARDFFRTVRLDDGREATLPGVPYRLSRTPATVAIHAGGVDAD